MKDSFSLLDTAGQKNRARQEGTSQATPSRAKQVQAKSSGAPVTQYAMVADRSFLGAVKAASFGLNMLGLV